jgi:hypothetical protein
MGKRNFPVIEGKYIVLKCKVAADNIQVITETCPYCGKRHYHGTGNLNWEKKVQIIEGIRTLGSRESHCVPQNVTITLADGTKVCNRSGYILGIGDQVPA